MARDSFWRLLEKAALLFAGRTGREVSARRCKGTPLLSLQVAVVGPRSGAPWCA